MEARNTARTTLQTHAQEAATGRDYEPPSFEEISLCCEIFAYAPDGDDRPLF